jgi:hypothetical protein
MQIGSSVRDGLCKRLAVWGIASYDRGRRLALIARCALAGLDRVSRAQSADCVGDTFRLVGACNFQLGSTVDGQVRYQQQGAGGDGNRYSRAGGDQGTSVRVTFRIDSNSPIT